MKHLDAMDAIDTEKTARVDVSEVVQRRADACDDLKKQLQRSIAREDSLRKVLAAEKEIVAKLHGIILAKSRQVDQYEAICNDLMDKMGEGR